MTRPEYKVSWGDESFVKFAWNSARKEIESVLRDMARKNCCYYVMVSFEGQKDERGSHIYGKEVWISNEGEQIVFTIERTKERR